LFESLTGARMMCNYMRFGGCRVRPPARLDRTGPEPGRGISAFLDEFEALLTGNEILIARTQGVGVLPPKLAVNAGMTGPMLRASGVNYDIRKVDAYGVYGRFKFRVPLGERGDVFDRYMLRILEMRESLKILDQAMRDLPGGPIMDPKAKLRQSAAQTRRGLWPHRRPERRTGFLPHQRRLGPNPYRYRVRPPSLINLTILEDMCLGQTMADAVVILGSVDIVLGEVDR
jgi:NADH-quinone oxidoreductase subunit D